MFAEHLHFTWQASDREVEVVAEHGRSSESACPGVSLKVLPL